MDINSLRIFLAVAEIGSVTGAAEELNYVQSNVTARIKNLEETLNTPLFFRKRHGMRLTPAGEKLTRYARKIIHLTEEAKNSMGENGNLCGQMTFGAMETTAAIRLPGPLANFHRRYPCVEIHLHTGTTAELREKVLDYRIEGAFVGGPFNHPDIEQEEIFLEEMVLVTQEGGRGIHDTDIKALIGFKAGCSYQAQLDDWLAMLKRPALKMMQFGSLEAILGCVRAGMGVSLLPKSIMEHEPYGKALTLHAVPDDFAHIATMFVHRRDMPPSKNLSVFLKRLKSGPPQR